jgi:hypothetical protein
LDILGNGGQDFGRARLHDKGIIGMHGTTQQHDRPFRIACLKRLLGLTKTLIVR